MHTFAFAPMSALMRVITLVIVALAVVFLALGRVLVAPAGLLVALIAIVWLVWRPLDFAVGAHQVVARYPLRRKRFPLRGLTGVTVLDGPAFRARFGLAMRVGVGGLFGGFGWLRTTRGGWVEMDLSRTDGIVLLEWADRMPWIVTPDDPARFAELVRLEARLAGPASAEG